MFAGKSSALLSRIRRHRAIGKQVMVITSSLDKRYSVEPALTSHDKESVAAIAVAELDSYNCLCFGGTWKKGHPICPMFGFFKLRLSAVKFYSFALIKMGLLEHYRDNSLSVQILTSTNIQRMNEFGVLLLKA